MFRQTKIKFPSFKKAKDPRKQNPSTGSEYYFNSVPQHIFPRTVLKQTVKKQNLKKISKKYFLRAICTRLAAHRARGGGGKMQVLHVPSHVRPDKLEADRTVAAMCGHPCSVNSL